MFEPKTEINVGSGGLIKLDLVTGSDEYICRVARSTSGADKNKLPEDDRGLIRYLIRHMHTTPIEFGEAVFFVRCPMDVWRQWIRTRMASVNEYSTRYRPAIDESAELGQDEWRLQSKGNRQGSDGGQVVDRWPDSWSVKVIKDYRYGDVRETRFLHDSSGQPIIEEGVMTPGEYLCSRQSEVRQCAQDVYKERLEFGVAFEVARKDLTLSTYTEAYWKCDLNNLLKFLSLRMDHHAQQEIREYANAMYELVRPHFPMLFEAFDDFDPRRGGLLLTRLDVEVIRDILGTLISDPSHPDWQSLWPDHPNWLAFEQWQRDQGRKTIRVGERDECIVKLKRLGVLPQSFTLE